MSEHVDLSHVIELIRSGEKAEARQILLNVLKTDRNNEEAWLYMVACAESKAEFESSILQVLRINPLNNQAIRLAEKHGIKLPKEVKQARKQARKKPRRSRAVESEKRGGSCLLRILLLLIVIGVVAAAALFFTQQNKDDETSTEVIADTTSEATEDATEEADLTETEATEEATDEATDEATEEIAEATTEEATEVPTEVPTEAPTEEPTITFTPSLTPLLAATATPLPPTETPTRTPTPEPSLTPTSSVIPVLQLVYDVDKAYILNISTTEQDISELRFVQETPSGEPIEFAATDWQEGSFRGSGSVYALQPASCFQVGIDIGPTSRKPAECVRLNGWVTRGIRNQFWLLNNASVTSFQVMHGNEVIAECEIDAGMCEFGFPE